jgi:hypothetical protein
MALDLGEKGEPFFERLEGQARNLLDNSGLELIPDAHEVCFSICQDIQKGKRHTMALTKKKLDTEWRRAVKWIVERQRTMDPEDEIYATIKRAGG